MSVNVHIRFAHDPETGEVAVIANGGACEDHWPGADFDTVPAGFGLAHNLTDAFEDALVDYRIRAAIHSARSR